MESETALPGLAEPTEVSLKPALGREAPVVWVQALAVHSEWPAQAGTLLREIRLRRGLNILWAEPAPSGTQNRTSGHATGKTTFCRLLRYVLDDADSGTKDFRQRFQKNFPRGGWALGEVIVDGKQWLVGRPLNPGFHPFAVKGGSLADAKGEKPLRGGYEDYQDALDAAAFRNVTLRNLSGTNRRLTWDCLLEWLTRDQEARFAGLLEWRHTDSDYESPMLVAADKENLVRIVLGLVEAEEQKLLRDYAKKSSEHTTLVEKRPKLEFIKDRNLNAVGLLLDFKVEAPKSDLEIEALRQSILKKATEWRAEAVKNTAAIQNAEEDQPGRQVRPAGPGGGQPAGDRHRSQQGAHSVKWFPKNAHVFNSCPGGHWRKCARRDRARIGPDTAGAVHGGLTNPPFLPTLGKPDKVVINASVICAWRPTPTVLAGCQQAVAAPLVDARPQPRLGPRPGRSFVARQ